MIKLRKNTIQQFSQGLAELLFPPSDLCPVCRQEPTYRQGLGRNCLKQVALIEPPHCAKCGRPKRLDSTKTEFCRQCNSYQYYFTAARAVGLYEGALREYLAEIKYRYRPDLGRVLGKLILARAKLYPEFCKIDLIIPIPIHQLKMLQRGYNQAELLAQPLAEYLGKSLRTDILIRTKNTSSQSNLNKEERFKNIDGAFRVVNPGAVSGKRILIIDDILTTGATASEVSRNLLRAGAREVRVFTLAIGVASNEWLTS